jgi:hypothetical protein
MLIERFIATVQPTPNYCFERSVLFTSSDESAALEAQFKVAILR